MKNKLIFIFNCLYWAFKAISEIFSSGEEILKAHLRYKQAKAEDSKNQKEKKL